MNARTPLVLAFAASLLAAGLAAAQDAKPKKLYRWVDKDGKVQISDQLPPEEVGRARKEYSASTGSLRLNGQPLDRAGSYRVTVNGFLAAGGDNFSVFKQGSEAADGVVGAIGPGIVVVAANHPFIGVLAARYFANYIVTHPEVKHGDIRILFTPDEEVGRGVDHLDIKKLNADYGYTLDGGVLGSIEDETFSADAVKITIHGISAHPGYAKGKMINSMLLANQFISKLPKNEIPEKTKGYEGFFHVVGLTGSIEETVVELIIRDHSAKKFKERKEFIHELANKFNKKWKKQFGEEIVVAEVKDQYYNMKEKVKPVFHIVEIAEKAMKELGIKPIIKPIRGGTDGCQLSYKGLPCPNIFAGGHNFHGKYEYVPVESMVKATEVIVKIAEITALSKK